jgi:hypothetical protein
MMMSRASFIGLLGLCLLAGAARADEPSALVEAVTGAPAGIQLMEYLEVGRTIELGPRDTIVVDYLRSCIREIVTGGVLTIGPEQSMVAGGTLQREKVECDGGHFHPSAEQSGSSGVIVFRGERKPDGHRVNVVVERTLYGLSPLIDLRGAKKLVIERLDPPEERVVIDIRAGDLVNGSFYDFAKAQRRLVAGGIYRASADGRSIVFKIARAAKPGQSPLAGRLLRL